MNTERDQDLLRQYAERGSEAAFAELVRRYVDFVYSSAFRMVRNPQLAEEVTQAVFVALSQNVRALSKRTVLSGWLHRTARNLAAKAVRTEVRRRNREQESALMNEPSSSESNPLWEEIAPQLDAALEALREPDRDMVLLRFFHQRTSREIGDSFGLSEEAAKKRVARAVEQLRTILASRGVAVSASALVAAMTANSIQAAPAGLAAAAIAGASAAGAVSAAATPLVTLFDFLQMTKLQTSLLALLFVAGLSTPILLSSTTNQQGSGLDGSLYTRAMQNVARPLLNTGSVPASEEQADTPLARLTAWVRQLDQTHQPYEPWSTDGAELDYLIWSLPLADYPKAWRLREGLRYAEIQNRLQRHLLIYWAELDPRAALVPAVSLNLGWGKSDPALGVLQTWAGKEPTAALAWISLSVPEKKQGSVLASVIPQVAKVDPQAALMALNTIASPMLREQAQSGLVRAWAGQSPTAAAAYVTRLPASSARVELVKSIAEAWAQKEPDAAYQWTQSLAPGREREGALRSALMAMAQTHPARAAALLETLEGDSLKVGVVFHILETWAKSDLTAAAEWTKQLWAKRESEAHLNQARQNSDRMLLDAGTDRLVEQWSSLDPRGAVEFVLSLPGKNAGRVQSAFTKWCARDSAAALGFANGLDAGTVRDAAIKGVCQGLAYSNPAQAADFVAKLSPGEVQSQAAVEVVYRWALTDPKAAAQWVVGFPEGQTRERAAEHLIEGWTAGQSDLLAAARWLEQLPAGTTRDKAAQAFARDAAWKEPELAAQWIGAFKDEVQRNGHIELIARRWLTTNPEAARKWLESTSLPAEKKQQLLAQ